MIIVNTAKKIMALLSPQELKQAYLLLGMILIMALLDTVGVASIMPFIAVLSDPNVVNNNRYLHSIYIFLDFNTTESFLFFLGLAVFSLLVLSIVFKSFTTYVMLRYTYMREYSIGNKLVMGYLYQPYEWFLNRHSAELGKSVLSEVSLVVGGVIIPLIQLLVHISVAAFLLILLIIVDPLLAITVAMCLGTAYTAIYLLLRKYLSKIGKENVEANQQRYRSVQEAFGGIKDVKISGLEKIFQQRFEEPAKRFAKTQAAQQVTAQTPRYLLEIIAFGGIMLVALFIISRSDGLNKALPVLSLYAFAGYRLMPSLQQIYAQLNSLRFRTAALDNIHNDLKQLSFNSQNITKSVQKPLIIKQGLQLNSIYYTYPNTSRKALNRTSLNIPVHNTIGIVGSTGSGKTTTADIILGLLQPNKGQLLVDNIPIKSDNMRAWQSAIGYVPQSIFLSDRSVASNIAFGMPEKDIDLKAVERAARIANLHDFVISNMPEGYNTTVGERGVRLSGGQRQRIGIARALYHDPQVTVKVAETRAVYITEQVVMEAVHNLANRKTIILIAHRLTTVRECDRIYLLENGKVVGEGSFDELVETNSHFKDMINPDAE